MTSSSLPETWTRKEKRVEGPLSCQQPQALSEKWCCGTQPRRPHLSRTYLSFHVEPITSYLLQSTRLGSTVKWGIADSAGQATSIVNSFELPVAHIQHADVPRALPLPPMVYPFSTRIWWAMQLQVRKEQLGMLTTLHAIRLGPQRTLPPLHFNGR